MEKLVIASGKKIYCIDKERAILVKERPEGIGGIAYHQGKLFDGGSYKNNQSIEIHNTLTNEIYATILADPKRGNSCVTETVENSKVVCRSYSEVSVRLCGLASEHTHLFAGVVNGGRDDDCIIDIAHAETIVIESEPKLGKSEYSVTKQLNCIAARNGRAYAGARRGRVTSTIESTFGGRNYQGWPLTSMTASNNDLYAAYARCGSGTIMIQEAGEWYIVAERSHFVTAMALCNGRLFDAVYKDYFANSKAKLTHISDTRADRNPEANPLFTIDSYVQAMVAVPERLWEELAEQGK